MTKDKVLLSKIDANIHVIRAESQEDTGSHPLSETDVLPSDCSGCPLYRAAHKGDTVSVELTRAELDWLRVATLTSHMRTSSPAVAYRIYGKLKKLSK